MLTDWLKSAVKHVDVVIAVSFQMPSKLIEIQGYLKEDLITPMTNTKFTGWDRWTHKKRWKILLIVVLVLIAGWFVSHRYLDNQIAAEIQRIRVQGHPVTLTDLEAWYPKPQGQNAADIYLAAFEARVEDPALEQLLPGLGNIDWPLLGESLTDETVLAMRQYLQTQAEALTLFHQASQIQNCRYPLDCHVGLDRLYPHSGELKDAAILLAMDAYLNINKDHYKRTTDVLGTMAKLAASLRMEPTLISYLLHLSLRAQAWETLEYVLAQRDWPSDQLTRLAQIFDKKWDDRDTLIRAMAGERCDGLDVFESFHRYNTDPGRRTAMRWYQQSILFKLDKLTYLRTINDWMARLNDPLLNSDHFDMDLNSIPIYYPISRIMISPFKRWIVTHNRATAQGRTATTAIAVKRYHNHTGQFPTQLTDLVPKYLDAIPIDPFDGQPLRYQLSQDDKQATIYSVGNDLADNHGTRLNLENRPYKDGTDIVFVVD